MANNFYGANKLTGGTAGCLDDISYTVLSDGDGALVIDAVTSKSYEYTYDSSSSASPSSPSIINPSDNGGNGRWVLTDVITNDFECTTLTCGDITSEDITCDSVTAAAGATIVEFSTDGAMAGNSDTVVPTEKAIVTYVSGSGVSAASFPGYKERSRFMRKDADEMYIYPGAYNHNGTSEQIVYWDSVLTLPVTIGGTQFYYLYLDDSAIIPHGSPLLTATEFDLSPVGPTWDSARHAFYRGADRCIFAFHVTAGVITPFKHSGGEFVSFDESIVDRSISDLDTTWTSVTLTTPDLVDAGGGMTIATEVTFVGNNNAATTSACSTYWRQGSSGDDGHLCLVVDDSSVYAVNTTTVMADANQQIDIKNTVSSAHQLGVETNGFYLPGGM